MHLRDAVEVVRGVGCRGGAADADGGQLEAGRVLNATGDGSDGVALSGADTLDRLQAFRRVGVPAVRVWRQQGG